MLRRFAIVAVPSHLSLFRNTHARRQMQSYLSGETFDNGLTFATYLIWSLDFKAASLRGLSCILTELRAGQHLLFSPNSPCEWQCSTHRAGCEDETFRTSPPGCTLRRKARLEGRNTVDGTGLWRDETQLSALYWVSAVGP
jgi:hypothetical protein